MNKFSLTKKKEEENKKENRNPKFGQNKIWKEKKNGDRIRFLLSSMTNSFEWNHEWIQTEKHKQTNKKMIINVNKSLLSATGNKPRWT